MGYDQFIERNKGQIFALYLMWKFFGDRFAINALYQMPDLSDEEMDEFKDRVNDCMPRGSMMLDLWFWDEHFENNLENDWYFEAAFGDPDSAQSCADTLAEYFMEAVDQYDIDYDQNSNQEAYEALVQEEAIGFIKGWRGRIFSRYSQPSE